jgi:hypothetical protein
MNAARIVWSLAEMSPMRIPVASITLIQPFVESVTQPVYCSGQPGYSKLWRADWYTSATRSGARSESGRPRASWNQSVITPHCDVVCGTLITSIPSWASYIVCQLFTTGYAAVRPTKSCGSR